mgnify:CR=1 FL=1
MSNVTPNDNYYNNHFEKNYEWDQDQNDSVNNLEKLNFTKDIDDEEAKIPLSMNSTNMLG